MIEAYKNAVDTIRLLDLPASRNYAPETLRNIQAQMFVTRSGELSHDIKRDILELGYLLVEGGEQGVHDYIARQLSQKTGEATKYSTMEECVQNHPELNIPGDICRLAIQRYELWLQMRKFGYAPNVLWHKDIDNKIGYIDETLRYAVRNKKISANTLMRQTEFKRVIEEKGFVVPRSPDELDPSLKKRLYALVDERDNPKIRQQIDHILSTDPDQLRSEKMTQAGVSERIPIVIPVRYDPVKNALIIKPGEIPLDEDVSESLLAGRLVYHWQLEGVAKPMHIIELMKHIVAQMEEEL